MRRDADHAEHLLAAYVDGVGELGPDERRRIEATLAEPAGRAEEQATRALIGQLRELPPLGGEPDWGALERSIGDAVGPTMRRTWWRGWRWVIPATALALTAAIAVLVMRPADEPPPTARALVAPQPTEPVVQAPPIDDTVALWLDGREVEVQLGADDLLDDPITGDGPIIGLDDLGGSDGLLEASDLAGAIDELDDDALGRAEHALEHPHHRKKS